MNDTTDPLISGKLRPCSGEHVRQSLTERISTRVSRQLSVLGSAEEPRTGGVLGTTINTLCNVVGAGVLSLPLAFYKASVAGGIGLMLCTCVLATVSAYIIVIGSERTKRFAYTEVMAFSLFPPRTFEEFCASKLKPLSEDFIRVEKGAMEMEKLLMEHNENEIERRKRRRVVTVLVELIVFLSNYGSLIVFARVIADSIPPVVHTFLHGSGFFITRTFWLLISGIIFLGLTCVRNMGELRWTSLLGFLSIFYVIVSIVARYVTSRSNPPYPNVDPAEHGDTNWYHGGVGVVRAISNFCVAFSFHYNIPYFYRELKDRRPNNMMKSVFITYPIVLVCYLSGGLLGYLTFGNLVASHEAGGDIMRNYPEEDNVINVGRLVLFLHFACVYPILSICARRGLHRLLMTALTWGATTSCFREEREMSQGCNGDLLSALPEVHTTPASGEVDRDVGSPENTTRLAIVLEAFFIVVPTVVMAAFIPGIGLVINILGTLFGVFLVFTGPGIIAWALFSEVPLSDPSLQAARVYRCGRLLKCVAVLLMCSGIVSTLAGLFFLIKDNVT